MIAMMALSGMLDASDLPVVLSDRNRIATTKNVTAIAPT
jgi:hypothetical protein